MFCLGLLRACSLRMRPHCASYSAISSMSSNGFASNFPPDDDIFDIIYLYNSGVLVFISMFLLLPPIHSHIFLPHHHTLCWCAASIFLRLLVQHNGMIYNQLTA